MDNAAAREELKAYIVARMDVQDDRVKHHTSLNAGFSIDSDTLADCKSRKDELASMLSFFELYKW